MIDAKNNLWLTVKKSSEMTKKLPKSTMSSSLIKSNLWIAENKGIVTNTENMICPVEIALKKFENHQVSLITKRPKIFILKGEFVRILN